MKKPRKPKLKSLPKKPRSGASVSVLENYKKRAEDVVKDNNAKVKEYNKAVDSYYAEQKRKDKLRNSVDKKHTVKFK